MLEDHRAGQLKQVIQTLYKQLNSSPNRTYSNRTPGNATCIYALPNVPNTPGKNLMALRLSLPPAWIRRQTPNLSAQS
jgi:hypothetical protein